ncbi:MAG: hypothetical protein JO222_09935, partial [Frankiales bacterium]|nr:hypothetical protein [Frankiales bacterium]
MASTITVRDATDDDVPAIAAIYAHAVLHGTGTFESDPPDDAEIAVRRTAVLAAGLPYLVATDGERVVGFAYAATYRPRPAYLHTA